MENANANKIKRCPYFFDGWHYQRVAEIEQKIIYAICIGKSEDVCGALIKGSEQAGCAQYASQYLEKNIISDEWSGYWKEEVFKNCADPDLNISITALHFGITPSYLSALFKE